MDVKKINFDFEYAGGINPDRAILEESDRARSILEKGDGPGSDFLGWVALPESISAKHIQEIASAAERIRRSDGLVVVGIGGSYLGARAVIEALRDPFADSFPIYYAGHHLDANYHKSLFSHLSGKKYSVNVISKSGTTTEPGIAFRILMEDLVFRYGPESLKELVVATTDAKKGSLRTLSDREGIPTFIIPDDVGGRYSFLTPVGLLPIAAAGLDMEGLVLGAKAMMELVRSEKDPSKNPALLYAAYRNLAYKNGKKIEIMASYLPSLQFVSEWWKQLYGESEGKNHRGIFPASVQLTTDLHSMGQWIQDGERTIFQTVLDVKDSPSLKIPETKDDEDGLNYLAGRELNEVNRTALLATAKAHASGEVPVARLELPELNEFYLGALLYMFEYACGVSAYMLGVNPFDQPGVEAYKKSMFQMLGKPGHS